LSDVVTFFWLSKRCDSFCFDLVVVERRKLLFWAGCGKWGRCVVNGLDAKTFLGSVDGSTGRCGQLSGR
jgi:hypothetical protein